MTKIVEFIGGSWSLVQYEQRSDDVWTVNITGTVMPNASMHWNMDDLKALEVSAELYKMIREFDCSIGRNIPIMTSRAWLPFCVEYPLQRILNYFRNEVRWFNHTPSYMFPYAIAEGFEEIHVHGFDYLGGNIRTAQYLNTLTWAGICAKHGVRVRWNPVSKYLRELYHEHGQPFTYEGLDQFINLSPHGQFYGYYPQPVVRGPNNEVTFPERATLFG